MRLTIIAVGHKMPAWVSAGYEDYARRMPPDMALALTEIKPGHRVAGEDGARARQLEAERIVAALPAGCVPVVLDERGVQTTTRELADWMRRWMDEGVNPAFVIGGADGLDDTVKARAHKLLGLSRLTLPHALVRVVLAEQLYRAVSVLKGHPYHRD
ncbi:MAG: 23S rRNA (pseudouridine(1915)-N(3))-methyltransferase RlmH [Thiobacillaceae bacterium]